MSCSSSTSGRPCSSRVASRARCVARSPFGALEFTRRQINSANELILTELILENIFAAFEAEETVALLSAFIFQEKTEVEPLLTPRLDEGRAKLLEIQDRVAAVSAKHRAEVEGESTRDGDVLRFGLVEVVLEWAKGMVRPLLLSTLEPGRLTRLAAFQPDHRLDRRARRHHRPGHHEARRDVPRGEGRGASYWGRDALPKDGKVPVAHQAVRPFPSFRLRPVDAHRARQGRHLLRQPLHLTSIASSSSRRMQAPGRIVDRLRGPSVVAVFRFSHRPPLPPTTTRPVKTRTGNMAPMQRLAATVFVAFAGLAAAQLPDPTTVSPTVIVYTIGSGTLATFTPTCVPRRIHGRTSAHTRPALGTSGIPP